jgi:23S rRNA pseudouridine1911/1915/1917 synthase
MIESLEAAFAPAEGHGFAGLTFTTAADEVRRLDQFIAGRTQLSRHAARRLIEEGQVRVEGRVARKPGLMLVAGQRVSLSTPPQDPRKTPPVPQSELPLEVLYEDGDVVVVNKPAGWPTHPLRPGERGTLASALVARYPECVASNPEAREGGLCQRLDLYTSGAIVASRNAPAFSAMRAHLREGHVEKEYLALVVGVPESETLEVSLPILPAPGPFRHRRLVTATTPEQVYHPDALDAQTRFVVLARSQQYTLLRAEARTGRRHQVRAHLAYLGLPLVGDTLYGAPPFEALAEGYFLHASRIRFPAITKADIVDVTAPLPADRARILHSYGLLVPVRP